MKSFRIFVLAAAVAASFSLVACNGDAADTNGSDTTATIDSMPTATPEPASTPTVDTMPTAPGATSDTMPTTPGTSDTTAAGADTAK